MFFEVESKDNFPIILHSYKYAVVLYIDILFAERHN